MACPSKKSTLPLTSRQLSLAVTVSTVSITSTDDDDLGPPRAITQIERAQALSWSVHPSLVMIQYGLQAVDPATRKEKKVGNGEKFPAPSLSESRFVPPLTGRGRWPYDETLIQPSARAKMSQPSSVEHNWLRAWGRIPPIPSILIATARTGRAALLPHLA